MKKAIKQKKAFTLVELTAVLVILGVLLMIIIPIVNNSINESKQKMYDEQIDRVINEAIKYSINNDLGYEDEMYKTLPFDDLLKDGLITEIPIDPFTNEELEGCLVYSWMNNLDNYDIKYDKDCDPTDDNAGFIVTIDLVPSKTSPNGWVNSDYTVDVVTNASDNKHCISNTTCTPDIENADININADGIYTVCAVGIKGIRESEVLCKEFKLDKTTPTITAKQGYIILEPGTDAVVKDFFDTTFGPSGGNHTCDITNTNELLTAENTVTCTATGNNGKTATTSTIFHLNIPNLMVSGETFQSFIGNYRSTITEVNFLSTMSGKYDAASIKWDLSLLGNNVVLGYIEEVDGKQILNIEANGDIIAHEQLGGNCTYSTKKSMFCYFSKVEAINFNNVFDTSNVTDMSSMFSSASSLVSLDASSFDTSNVTNMSRMFGYAKSLVNIDMSSFDTTNVTDMSYMFASTNSLTTLNVSNFNTNNVTNMSNMFYYASKLTNLDLSNFDTSKVVDMSCMFSATYQLTNLNLGNFNTSNVTNMSEMFRYADAFTSLNLSNFDTSNVTDMSHMFEKTRKLTYLDLSNFDTSNVTDMSYMFSNARELSELNVNNFNTSSVTTMSMMFNYTSALESLNVSSFNTINVTDMSFMFASTKKLRSINLSNFDTSNATSMYHMFSGAERLTYLELSSFDTSKVTNMSYMFASLGSLRNLDISSFDTTNVTDVSYMFQYSLEITTAYARTQTDANKFNSSSNKPSNVNFIVKP